jgi:hypothetical protein
MTRVVSASVLAALVFVLVACGGSPSSVVGTWVLETESGLTPEQRKAMESVPELKKAFEQAAAKLSMEIELRANGTVRGNFQGMGEKTSDGSWEEKNGVVTIKGDDGPPLELRLKDGKLVGPMRGSDRVLTFRRK